MLFGGNGAGEKTAAEETPAPAPAVSAAATVTEDTMETIEMQPADSVPNGITILSRIEELFSGETLKTPAIKEDALFSFGTDEAADATILINAPPPSEEADFEETLIMDPLEVKDFLRENTAAQEPFQKDHTGGEESGTAKEAQPDLIGDPLFDAEKAPPAELIIDEKDTGDTRDDGRFPLDPLKEGPSAAPAAVDDTVTGDDVVRLMAGFFEGQEDKAISEIVGPETIDDFFEGSALVVEPLPAEAGPGEIDAFVSPGDDKAPPVPLDEQEEETAMPAPDDTISGDDVAQRIEGYFGRHETEPAEGRPAADSPTSIATGQPPPSSAEGSDKEATLAESGAAGVMQGPPAAVTDAAAMREPGEEPSVPAADDTISGDDIVNRIDGMFGDTEENRGAAAAGSAPKGAEAEREPGTDDTRVVDAGRPSETDVIEDTVAENGAAGIISGADVEERIEEYFHGDAGDETAFAEPRSERRDIDKEDTVVFTDFAAGNASDAPPLPPEVPLFTNENPRSPDEETIINEIPPGPDIPDHVLTPTLADIYLQQGQPTLALTIYRRLLEKKPDNGKLAARIKEIEKAQAEGTLPSAPQAQKPAAERGKTIAAKKSARQKPRDDDTRPLAGVRLKKRPRMNWRKKG